MVFFGLGATLEKDVAKKPNETTWQNFEARQSLITGLWGKEYVKNSRTLHVSITLVHHLGTLTLQPNLHFEEILEI